MHAILRTPLSARRASSSKAFARAPLALVLALAAAVAPAAALAQVASTQLPTGGSIAGGTGTINAASGATLTIDQTSARMVLTWSAFDVGSPATVTFNQPSSTSAILNLVQGGNPTQLFGNLNSNGQVFLVNANGMIFGSTANINVGGLVASTLGITASNFMSGNDVLDAGANTVALMSNGGTITAAAGGVALIGGKVLNSGTITATGGAINLVAADKVTLAFASSGFAVTVDKALQLQLDTLAVDNSGSLLARGGTVSLQARAANGMFNQLINNSGVINASAISAGADGSVSLVANGANQTGIGGGGSIDVGGGTISVSTDRAVQQSGVYTAGTLSGSIGGAASFSGANQLAALGALNVGGDFSLTNSAALVQSGALTVGGATSISMSGRALTLTNAGNSFGGAFSATASALRVAANGNLSIGTLNLGANNVLSLIAAGTLTLPAGAIDTGTADLTLSSAGNLATRASLSGANVSLTGASGIALGHNIGATGTLALSSTNSAITQSGGALSVSGVATVSAGSGAITLTRTGNDFGPSVNLAGGPTQIVDGGALTLGTLATGDLSVTSTGALNLGSGTVAGALQATSNGGAISQSTGSPLTVTGTSNLAAGSGAITLATNGNHFSQAVSLGGGTTQIVDSGALTLGTLSTGALTATSNGALNLGSGTVSGTLQAVSNGGAISQSTVSGLSVTGTSGINAGAGAITLATTGNHFSQAVTLTGGATSIADSGVLTLGAATVGAFRASSATDLNLTGTITATSAELAAGGNFLNDAGAGALNVSDGAWRVYLAAPAATHRFGGLDSGNTAIWNSAAFVAVGASGKRYVFAYQPVISVSSTDATKVYGATADVTNNFSMSGLMAGVTGAYLGDSLATAVGSGAPSLSSAGTASTAAVSSGYTIDVQAGTLDTSTSGYRLDLLSVGQLSVSPAALTIAAGNAAKTYGQTTTFGGYQVTGLLNADSVSSVTLASSGAPVTAGVGDYAITASAALGSGLSNYTIGYTGGTLTVSPAALTIAAGDAAKTYGQTTTFGGYQVTGLVNADSVSSVSLASAGAPATAGVGDYAITASAALGSGLSNYTIGYTGGTLTVSPAALTIAAGDAAKIYGQTSALGGYQVTGLLNADSVSSVSLASAGAPATAGVGDYAITASNALGSGLSNYTIGYTGGTLAVTPAALTIAAGDAAKIYGQTTTLGGYQVTGLLNADSVSSVSLASSGAPVTAGVGDYAITASAALGSGLANYTIGYTAGTLAVTPAALTIAAGDAAKIYGQTTTLGGYQVTGLLNADSVSSVSLASSGAPVTAGVGDYAITASAALGSGLSNYTIGYTGGTLAVSPAALTIAAGDAAKIYGQTSALGGYQVTGLVNADSVSSVSLASTGAPATAGVGNYAITASDALGSGLSNYTIGYTGGTLAVSPAALTIAAGDAAKIYGQTTTLGGYQVTGLLNADSVSSVSLASGGAPVTAGVGNYAITASDALGSGLSNYTIGYTRGTLVVSPAALTIAAGDAAKIYGQTSALGGYRVTGLLNADSVSSVSLASTGTAATAGVGNYAITASNALGSGLSNYTIGYTRGTLAVSPAALTIIASDETKRFGSSARLNGFTVVGLMNGDTVSALSMQSQGAAPEAAPGTYTIVAASASGQGLSNYRISYSDGSLAVLNIVSSMDAMTIARAVQAANQPPRVDVVLPDDGSYSEPEIDASLASAVCIGGSGVAPAVCSAQ